MSRQAMQLALDALLADDAVSQPSQFRWEAIVTLEAVLAQDAERMKPYHLLLELSTQRRAGDCVPYQYVWSQLAVRMMVKKTIRDLITALLRYHPNLLSEINDGSPEATELLATINNAFDRPMEKD